MGRENKECKVVEKRETGNEGWKESLTVNG